MLHRRLAAVLVLVGLVAVPVLASDEAAPPAVQAQALVREGKLEEARDAYVAAAKADPENAELRAHAQILSRVLVLESLVAKGDPSPKWEKAVAALHVFYLGSDLHAKALENAKAAHAKADTALTASLVAETLLEQSRNEEAATFFDTLREGQKDDQVMVLQGIALGRLGRHAEVREAIDLYGLPETTDPNLLFDVARMQALLGDAQPALATLTDCFENCPARVVPALRTLVSSNPDLASLREHEGFAKVLATASKLQGTGCGCESTSGGCGGCGGGDCGSCDKGPKGEKKEKGGCGGCGKEAAPKE